MKISINKSLIWLFFITANLIHGHTQNTCTNPILGAWGDNSLGQLGDGTQISKLSPVQIGSNTDWKQVCVGTAYTLAIKNDGTLWAWGANSFGRLGDGTTIDRPSPVQIGNSADWKQVVARSNSSYALKNNGSLWAWGENSMGQLGNGTTVGQLSPVQIGNSTDWKQISAGALHSLAVKNDGSLWAWGYNGEGRLGDGTIINKTNPIQIGTNKDWIVVSAGSLHSVALKSDGSLWAWGYNANGQLGDGTTASKLIPTKIGNSLDWKQVSAGGAFTVAIKTNSTLWAWGSNSVGQLGDGTTNAKITPIQISGIGWQQIAASENNTISLKTDGSLWAWGNNQNGQLGDGTTIVRVSPRQIGLNTDWKQVSSSSTHTVALKCGTLNEFSSTKCYRILSKVSARVLEVSRASQTDGAQIYQFSWDNKLNQIWQFIIGSDGKYNIMSRNSLKLMDVLDCTEGSLIKQYAADGTTSQKWSLELQADGSFKLLNTSCNKYLRLEGGNSMDATNVGIKNDFGAESFKWFIQEVPCFPTDIVPNCYHLINKASQKVLEVKDASTLEGSQIYQWAADETKRNQLWRFYPSLNGNPNTYSFMSLPSNKLMDVTECTEGTIIKQFEYDGTNSQNWNVELQLDGYVKIRNVTCNKYLRVESGSSANGTNVGIKNDFGAESFKWHIQEVACVSTSSFLSNADFTFEAKAIENRAQLQWITKSYNNDYFEVERLNTQGNFETLDKQNAFEGLQSYAFTDNNPLEGDNFYRIKTVSNTAPPQYSEVKKVSFLKNTGVNIYPNPANGTISLDLKNYEGKTVNVFLYNNLGIVIKRETIGKATSIPYRFDIQNVKTGAYLIRVQAEGKRDVMKQVIIAE